MKLPLLSHYSQGMLTKNEPDANYMHQSCQNFIQNWHQKTKWPKMNYLAFPNIKLPDADFRELIVLFNYKSVSPIVA